MIEPGSRDAQSTKVSAPPAPADPAEITVSVPEPLASDTASDLLGTLGSLRSEARVRIDMGRVRRVDTFGLAALASGIRALRSRGCAVNVVALDPAVGRRASFLRVHDVLEASEAALRPRKGVIDAALERVENLLDSLIVILAMFYEGIRYAVADCASRALGRQHLARQLDQVGVGGVPIVVGVTFLIGAIMAFQTAYILEWYGATNFVARGVGLSMTRELGPLMAAVLLAGRSGSAIAAELGAMVVYEEVDALDMMALEPRRFLFSPRFAALVLSVPALSILADISGVLGGATVMVFAYHLSWSVYFNETFTTIYVADIGSGLIKSLFYGAIIAAVSCHRGLSLRGGPEAVGRAATSAVVQSIVAIVIFDAVFTGATRGWL